MKMRLIDIAEVNTSTPSHYEGCRGYVATAAVSLSGVDVDKLEYVTYKGRPSRANLQPRVGDVIFAKMKATNKVLFVDAELSKNIYSTGFYSISPNRALIDAKYLVQFLKSDVFNEAKDAECHGVTQKALNGSGLSKLEIPLPPLAEQKRVAGELDRICELKKNAEERLALMDRLVKSRFVEMFGDPATNTKSWTIVELGDALVYIGNGKSFVCESFPRMGDAPAILKLSAATWGVYKPEENKALKPGSKYYPECEVRNGDLLFTRKNTFDLVGMCAYVRKTPPNLMLPDLIFRLETNGKIDKLYLANLINFDTFRASVRGLASGSAASMPNISKTRLLGLKIPLPPLALQREFAAFVAEVDKSKLVLRETIATMETLYKERLQEYFS